MPAERTSQNVIPLPDGAEFVEPKRGQYVRIQLSLRPEYARRLEQLRKRIGAGSYAEVVRDALKRHEQLESIMGPDDRLYVEKPDGTKTYIIR